MWIRQAVRELTPVNLTLLRFLIAAVAFTAFVVLALRRPFTFSRQDIPRLVATGAAAVPAYHISLNFAEQSVTAGTAGVLIATGPIFATILSAVYLREHVTERTIIGLLLGFAGVVVLTWFSSTSGSIRVDPIGAAAVVFSAFMYAVFSALAKPMLPKYGSNAVTVLTILTGTVLLLPLLSQSTIQQAATLSFNGWVAVVSLGLLSTVAANLLFFYALTMQKLSHISVQLYLVPLFSVVAGVLLLGESVGLNLVVGGAMILLGVRIATSGG